MQNINKHLNIIGYLLIGYNVIGIVMASYYLVTKHYLFLPVAIIVFSAAGILTGMGILYRKSWARTLGLIMLVLNIVSIPIGTIIGIYGLIVLSKEEAKPLFSSTL